MALPKFCYQKAFWVIAGLSISLIATTTGVIYADLTDDIESNQNRSIENSLKLEKINTDAIDKMYKNQILICVKLGVDCK